MIPKPNSKLVIAQRTAVNPLHSLSLNGARGQNRTTDTRIFKPQGQELSLIQRATRVIPTTIMAVATMTEKSGKSQK